MEKVSKTEFISALKGNSILCLALTVEGTPSDMKAFAAKYMAAVVGNIPSDVTPRRVREIWHNCIFFNTGSRLMLEKKIFYRDGDILAAVAREKNATGVVVYKVTEGGTC